MKKIVILSATALALSAETLPKIVVNADPMNGDANRFANSIEVIDSKRLNDRGARHFGDIITQMGNVNVSGGSSRAKFIQIRGMGERSQYERSPDTSVGFIIDGIDFSGVGAGANLFDVKQVEVLKGPQSVRFGASALAGLINIESNDPDSTRSTHIEKTVASYNQDSLGIATTGSFTKSEQSPQYRFVIHKNKSDGFYSNKTLDRKDANDLDELTIRSKLRFFLGDAWRADLTGIYLDLDNGYDKWARDNTRDTRSNTPGEDKQRSQAGAIKLSYEDRFKLSYALTYADHKLLNSYDSDWIATKNDFYEANRDRTNITEEFRLASVEPVMDTDWLIGFYRSNLREISEINEIWGGSLDTTKTDYDIRKSAIFGELDHCIGDVTLVGALRVEGVDSRYMHHEAGNAQEIYKDRDTLWGGQVALKYQILPTDLIYASVSKGYKVGGNNKPRYVNYEASKIKYKSEQVIGYEVGHKHRSDRLSLSNTIFYLDRKDAQLPASEQFGSRFRFYTLNANNAYSYGLESDAEYKATDNLDLIANAGLIKTSFKRPALSPTGEKKTRELAHAPSYQYMVATHFSAGGYFARVEAQGMDKFYFSNNKHDNKSKAYNIGNVKVGYEAKSWDLSIWCKNITDEKYATRGFYFDIDDDGNKKLYTALGDPRVVGATFRARF